ncbi:MAG TPA: glycosidase [Bacteroidetes bacterium]|nr:glycosidase [Bacteroidota bacterium]
MNHLYPFRRFEKNPILTRHEVPYPCNTVFNAAACKFRDQYILLLRIEDLSGRSHLTLARSRDGYKFTVDPEPWITPSPDPDYEPYERYGVEDPRITQIGDVYYITYTAYGPYGPRVAIGRTRDFVHFERVSIATEVDNKDAVLFPEKIGGYFVMIDRPMGMGGQRGDIWIEYSPDLQFWGRARLLLATEPAQIWSASKLGASTPPIKTEAGWLVFYHGVRDTGSGRLYRVGAMLLDLKNPEKILGRTPHFIFGPEEHYERTGDVPNVIFPCGAIFEDDGMIKLYYGAADTCIALAEVHVDEVIRLCRMNEKRVMTGR